jgi:UDP-3-O-[3-hydroxymyristoyl] glucosamine N-acyltransferase
MGLNEQIMKFPAPVAVRDIAEQIGATIIGDPDKMATGINEVHKVEPGDITFVDVKKYFKKSLQSAASVVLLNERVKAPEGKTLLLCEDPFEAYNNLIKQYRPEPVITEPISPLADIHPTVRIEPYVVIGPHVKIGAHSHIQSNVTIAEHTIIGEHVTIQAGSVIGTEAFYFKRTEEGYQKWRSGGRVLIEDHVDIGPGCTVNKGVSGDTVIGEGCKLDSQVHVGHDVVLGKRCLLAGQVGIGGNTRVGDDVIMYGQAGVAQNLEIGDRVIISAKAGVSKNLESGKVYFGLPAQEARTAYRELAALRHLPEFFSNYYK